MCEFAHILACLHRAIQIELLRSQGDFHDKPRSSQVRIFNPDPAIMRLDNSIRNGQSKSRAFCFGGEKWGEDDLAIFLGNAFAVVREFDSNDGFRIRIVDCLDLNLARI